MQTEGPFHLKHGGSLIFLILNYMYEKKIMKKVGRRFGQVFLKKFLFTSVKFDSKKLLKI